MRAPEFAWAMRPHIVAAVISSIIAVGGAVHTADASSCTMTTTSLAREAVQAAIDGAESGAVVCLPAGKATWTSTVTLAKPITLQGAGAGGFVGRSSTVQTIGTGARTFAIESGMNITVGATVTARYTNRTGAHSMTGTVASYGGGSLVLNVASVTGSGTYGAWIFERPATTSIVNAAGASAGGGMVLVSESSTGHVRITGIRFEGGAGVLGWHIKITGIPGGRPVLIHDNWFTMHDTGAVLSDVNRGVVYRNFFNGYYCSANWLGCTPAVSGALGVKNVTASAAWATPSTMGATDTDGTANFYVEDNVFVAFWQAMTGLDSYARMVLRRNLFVDAALGSHGAETENLGARHWEIYDNTFVQSDRNGDPYNINFWFYVRGGTGVITGNAFDDINTPGYWGDKPEMVFTIQALGRALSSPLSCWGANQAGLQYPAPRQVGFGYVDGTGGIDPLGLYRGDREPAYVWGNTGTGVLSVQDYPGTDCVNPDSSADYFVSGRDYFLNAGPKPGYAKFTYPHPLRGTPPQPATALRVVS